jgi:hypothetical protein|tara:strand:- start:474 stop:677 length:204 start_codon:yes stop_codon:yes gene_type:complete
MQLKVGGNKMDKEFGGIVFFKSMSFSNKDDAVREAGFTRRQRKRYARVVKGKGKTWNVFTSYIKRGY